MGSALLPVETVKGDGDTVPLFARLSWVFNASRDSRSLLIRASFGMSCDEEECLRGLRDAADPSAAGFSTATSFVMSTLMSGTKVRPLMGELIACIEKCMRDQSEKLTFSRHASE